MARKILIAEDEPSIVRALEFLLKNAGYDVAVAYDGNEALRMIESSPPDLLVLDIMLPIVNGFEVCRRIREARVPGDTRILMLTARGRESEIKKGLDYGADAYMTKPFATRELLGVVAELLARGAAASNGRDSR
ncbi:MAG: response regulator [Pseudomonadota bacterium]